MNFIELIGAIVLVTIIVTIATLIINRKPIPKIENDRDILLLLQNGNKIKAIKAYRQLHGVGLKEAKYSIEKLSNSKKENLED